LRVEIAANPELAWLVDGRETDSSHKWQDADHFIT